MALIVKDRVMETSTTTGTGNFTLAGAVTGFRAFSSVCSTSDIFYYSIEAVNASGVPTGDWETGLGTYSAANTLTRTVVTASSNSNAAVSFAAGTKRVSLVYTSTQLATLPVARTVLLCGFNGTNGATSFTDESSYARVATFNGNAALDTTNKQFGSASLAFDGTGDYVTFPTNAQTSIANSDDHTIEGFFRCTNVAGGGTKVNTLMSKRSSGGSGEFNITISAAGNFQLVLFNGSSGTSLTGTTTLSNSTWYYFACVRSLGTWTAFLGTPGGTASIEGTLDDTSPTSNSQALTVGREPFSTARDFTGNIDEIRWTRRAALYTAAFSVPSAEFGRGLP